MLTICNSNNRVDTKHDIQYTSDDEMQKKTKHYTSLNAVHNIDTIMLSAPPSLMLTTIDQHARLAHRLTIHAERNVNLLCNNASVQIIS
jgi:hypothetical protein